MLLDYLAERKRRVERKQKIVHSLGHHNTFVQMVEDVVCEICDVTPPHLRLRTRLRPIAHARFLIFYIAWQPGGFRSQGWLAKRFNIDPWSVQHGFWRVENTPELKAQAIQAMTILEHRLEQELFGDTRLCQSGSTGTSRFDVSLPETQGDLLMETSR